MDDDSKSFARTEAVRAQPLHPLGKTTDKNENVDDDTTTATATTITANNQIEKDKYTSATFGPSKASYIPTGQPSGFMKADPGFATYAEASMYNELYDKVMADEKQRREEAGLSPEQPSGWERIKSKLAGKKGN